MLERHRVVCVVCSRVCRVNARRPVGPYGAVCSLVCLCYQHGDDEWARVVICVPGLIIEGPSVRTSVWPLD